MSFEDKKKALFASLESAERSIPVDSVLHQDDNIDYDQSRRRHNDRDSTGGSRRNRRSSSERGPIKKFRGKESIFKRPAAPISKCLPMSRVPDFKKNPQKWTKYSLEDVDISDRSNTAAAFSFLREMEHQKQDPQPLEAAVSSDPTSHGFRGKVKFNRSIKLKSQLEEEQEPSPTEEEKPKVKSTKVIMPEYVIGQKTKKPKPVKLGAASSKRDRSKELKLDHLMDEEEDPDGEDDDDEMN